MRTSIIVLALVLPMTFASSCWQDAYGRGAGGVLHTCEEGYERDGALCYPKCGDGFYGVGPVCWRSCTDGFKDTGIDCLKPSAYGRGAGYVLWHEGKCNDENQDVGGCEKWGALWYPKCKSSFHNVACCICSPDCPDGFVDIGVSCQKGTYGRTAGKSMGCADDEEHNGALCYPKCKAGYHGNGPVCWADCPADKHSCGALCTDTVEECTNDVKTVVKDVFEVAVVVAAAYATGAVDMKAILEKLGPVATDLTYAICDVPTSVEYFLA